MPEPCNEDGARALIAAILRPGRPPTNEVTTEDTERPDHPVRPHKCPARGCGYLIRNSATWCPKHAYRAHKTNEGRFS